MTFSATTLAQEAPPSINNDAARGKRIFNLQCRACHSIDAGEPHKVGPNLSGMMTRPAAAAPDFKYSAPLKAAAIQWDAQKLDQWLKKPSEMVSGTTMAFEGLTSEKDRAAIFAYLMAATAILKP